MEKWTPRKVVDQKVEYPYRYSVVNESTGVELGIFDLVPYRVDGDIDGTKIDAEYLQPIEDYLSELSDELEKFGYRIDALDSSIEESKSNLNTRIGSVEVSVSSSINATNQRIESANEVISTLAPLVDPVLTNPTANTVAISTNNKQLATTSAVYAYLNSLMASFNS